MSVSEAIPSPEDKEWELTAAKAQASSAYNEDAQSRTHFPEVLGLCRTCSHALIRRRQYSEVPSVFCYTIFEMPHRVPLDITECSAYKKEGSMSLRDMHELGLRIDARKPSGQYL